MSRIKEVIVNDIRAYSKEVNGCVKFQKDVMISFRDKKGITDLFMTNEMAEQFHKELGEKIKENKDES